MSDDNNNNTLLGLSTILNDISELGDNNVTIYVSIGCAALSAHQNDISKIWTIDENLNQQYPQFLKSLKEELPFSPVHIILIDPELENPPFAVWDMSTDRTKPSDDWIDNSEKYKQLNIQYYYNDLTNIHVYALRDFVQYEPFYSDQYCGTNIDTFFQQLNCDSIQNNWFTVINDFSGKIMPALASYYDELLGNHINHIVYGLGARKDGGCYLPLAEPVCNFVYIIDSNCIKVFNPHSKANELDNNLISLLRLKCSTNYETDERSKKQYEIIKAQMNEYVKEKRRFISIVLMSPIRQFGMLIKDPSIVDLRGINMRNIYLLSKCKVDLQKLFDSKKYIELLDIFIDLLKTELIEHVNIVYKENTQAIIDSVINEMLSCDNPYKWYDYVKKLLVEFDQKTGINIALDL